MNKPKKEEPNQITSDSNALIGTWVSDPSEEKMWKRRGQWTIDFIPEGTMRWKIVNSQGIVESKYKFRIEKRDLVLSKPPLHDSRTRFRLTEDGKLLLYRSGRKLILVRK